MANFNHQQFWLTGSRFFFQRDPIGGTRQPIIDFGTIDPVSPEFEPETVSLVDSDGGIKQTVDERIIAQEETYDFTCYNINADMMALAFSADPPTDLTQAATAKTDIKHYAHPGRLLKILDANYDAAGDPARQTLGITSIDDINTAAGGLGDDLVEGTDYEVVSLERGLIRLLPGSTVFTAAGDLFITYTPRAISGSRLITPRAGISTNIQGRGLVVWGRNNFAQQTARSARFSIIPQTPNLQIDDYSSLVLRARVLSDLSLTEPAGRIEYWLGDQPDAS